MLLASILSSLFICSRVTFASENHGTSSSVEGAANSINMDADFDALPSAHGVQQEAVAEESQSELEMEAGLDHAYLASIRRKLTLLGRVTELSPSHKEIKRRLDEVFRTYPHLANSGQ